MDLTETSHREPDREQVSSDGISASTLERGGKKDKALMYKLIRHDGKQTTDNMDSVH